MYFRIRFRLKIVRVRWGMGGDGGVVVGVRDYVVCVNELDWVRLL